MQLQLNCLYMTPKCNFWVFSAPVYVSLKNYNRSFSSQTLSLTLKSVKTGNLGLFSFSQGSESLTMSEQTGQFE